jgi:hypothetical protein
MRKRKLSLHPASLLIGILIGAIALLILLVALPAAHVGASSAAQPQAGLVKAESQIKVAWSHFMAGLKTNSLSASAHRSCLQFRSWFNQQDDKLVSFFARHGMRLARLQISSSVCGSASAGSG